MEMFKNQKEEIQKGRTGETRTELLKETASPAGRAQRVVGSGEGENTARGHMARLGG